MNLGTLLNFIYKFFYIFGWHILPTRIHRIDNQTLKNFFGIQENMIEMRLVGPDGDGGYYVPNLKYEILLSPGVDNKLDFDFELACSGALCFLADYSVNPMLPHKSMKFTKKFISELKVGDQFISFKEWLQINNLLSEIEKKITILQIDVEANEYEILINMEESLLMNLDVIVIEFHRLRHLNHLLGQQLILSCLKKLNKFHIPIHCNVNNISQIAKLYDGSVFPDAVEITYIRADYVTNDNKSKNINTTHTINRAPEHWYK
jgi:hypothetical protein